MFVEGVAKKVSICLTIIITFLIILAPLQSVSQAQSTQIINILSNHENQSNEHQLDEKFIHDLTYNLSQIVFTEYDHGSEIPKGRYFGSKGELKAADILAENMSEIGLYVTKQRLEPALEHLDSSAVSLLEVLDYNIEVNEEKIECYIAPTWIHPKASDDELNKEINEQELTIKRIPKNPLIYDAELANEQEDFVFITQDQWNDPDWSIPIIDWLKPVLHPLKSYMLFHMTSLLKIREETKFFKNNYPHCKGYVLHDFNEQCYDMIFFDEFYKNFLPTIFINGSIGKKIWQNPDDYTLNMYLKQQYNQTIESYNVIGQINGTDPNKTIIISSLYDCWWNQGTADSAIGTAIVVAIAKYFIEKQLQPKYTMKFILFSGEECGMRGANYYEAVQKDEEIVYVIDLNQLGFTQKYPTLTFDIVANKLPFLNEIFDVAEQTNYYQRSGYETDLSKILMQGIPSNTLPFCTNRNNCNCVSFFKDGGWTLHHRNGQNYTEGDVFSYYNKTYVNLAGELILNITKHLSLEDQTNLPDHQFLKQKLSNYVLDQLTSFINIGPKNAR